MNRFDYRIDEINQWAASKGIHASSSAERQYLKLLEEQQELYKGILDDDIEAIKDAIGDCYVVLANMAWFSGTQGVKLDIHLPLSMRGPIVMFSSLQVFSTSALQVPRHWMDVAVGSLSALASAFNLTLEECVDQAVNTILKRTGKMVDGVFVKDA